MSGMDNLEILLLYVTLALVGLSHLNLLEKYNKLKSEVKDYAEKN